ncbi:sigma-70 family RNA polymerase sigma factor [Actinomadura atramentaria]|uniref:sigma-70 family RNA polymerase sigma factor n=1 Tax=Actinomadura atramentaria TaxID=1990 RepID=UPI00037CB5F0|nr:sigma-70 family RNA polymerase sigma factor [Actinomadura atramentaria]
MPTTATRPDGAQSDFERAAAPYRRELLAHCYRMLGSLHDAEDQVQETYLRAWRSYGAFEGRSSLRSWLYRIATNACLTALEQRARRPLPADFGDPADPERPVVAAREVPWLEPAPDALLAPAPGADPAAVVASREASRLAFVAALQHLPPRQRAVLLLRDVLRWRAAEVAELIGASTAAVNSALQRARARLAEVAPDRDALAEPGDPAARALLDRYARAFEDADVAALVELFRRDAVWDMPPYPEWFAGPEAIGRLVAAQCAPEPGELRPVATAANGQPAVALYRRGADGVHRAFQLQVVSVTAGGISRVTAFFDPALFDAFGLPAHLAPGVPG